MPRATGRSPVGRLPRYWNRASSTKKRETPSEAATTLNPPRISICPPGSAYLQPYWSHPRGLVPRECRLDRYRGNMTVSCCGYSPYAPRSFQNPLAVYRRCGLAPSTFSFSPLRVRHNRLRFVLPHSLPVTIVATEARTAVS